MEKWRAVESMGFDSGWTYDHIWWRRLPHSPWLSAIPLLAAVACATEKLRIGLMVASPNFRHPVLLAKDAVAVSDISNGRFVLGVGSGAPSAGDAHMLGGQPLTPAARADRFDEFVTLTRRLLREPIVSARGEYFSADEARVCPPAKTILPPFAVAASGRRGIELAAKYADVWITPGPADWLGEYTLDECVGKVREQVAALERRCEEIGRPTDEIERVFLATPMVGNPLQSSDTCLRLAEALATVGINHLVVHWPRADTIYTGDSRVLGQVAERVSGEIRNL